MKICLFHRSSGRTAFTAAALFAALTLSAVAGAEDARVAVRPEAIRQSMPTPRYQDYRPTFTAPSQPSYTPTLIDDTPNYKTPLFGTPSRPEPTISEELTYRYTDSRMTAFLRTASMSTLASMFMEVSQYIDQRHVNPASYEVRTARALDSLISAVEHPAFLQAAGGSQNSAAARQVQAELQALKTRQPARSSQQALGVMQYAASLVSRQMGVRQEAAAIEFINGTIDSLDRYSSFNPSSMAGGPSTTRLDAERQTAAGLDEHIVGIGVELKTHDEGVLIVGVIDGGPAAAAKLQRGDVITAIDGRSLGGLNLNQAADLITGPAGTRIGLRVNRDGRTGSVTLPRRSVYVSSVSGVKMIDQTNKVAYLRLKQFSESTSKDLDKALWSLHNQGMKTLVMDLRGNPGGLLDQAISVSNKFLPQGSIVSTKGRNPQDNTHETASFSRTWKVPLVVLVDENSASASEIFAAAIQDNQRGLIVGRNSYGKGTVQTHFPMRTVSGDLKLTTAKFYAPSGREMAGSGVRPDVAVPASQAGLDFSPERDGDIQTALRLAQDGQAANLAASSGRL